MPTESTESELIERHLDLLKKVLTASIYEEGGWSYAEPPPARFRGNPLQYLGRLLERRAVRRMARRSLRLVRTEPWKDEERREGRVWPLLGYTMVGHPRLDNIQFCVEDALRNGVPGDLIETGTWRGGASIFMRAVLAAHGVTDRTVWVADSFEGLPPPVDDNDGWDHSDEEILKVSLEQVRTNFARFDLLDDQVHFLEGWFSDTLPKAPIERLAVLRLDGDLYSSTMDALQALYDKMSPGGYVIADDYHSWPPSGRAVDEFLKERGISPEIETIDWAGAYFQVPA